MRWDEPTTIPGLRQQRGQIDLRLELKRDYPRDDLRSARGIIVAVLLSAAIIFAVWGAVALI